MRRAGETSSGSSGTCFGSKHNRCCMSSSIIESSRAIVSDKRAPVIEVRVNYLLCLGELIHTLDKQVVLDVLQTIQRCTAVDPSQPTLMCTLSVANAFLKQLNILCYWMYNYTRSKKIYLYRYRY